MSELLIALLPIAIVSGLALLALLVPLKLLVAGSLGLLALGFALGLPGGVGYHVILRRELVRAGALPHGWYWHPQRHHDALAAPARARVRTWFFAGALGFLLLCTGLTLAVTALAAWLRGGGATVLASL